MGLSYEQQVKVELSALAKILGSSSDWPGNVLEAAIKAKAWSIVKYLLIDSNNIPRVLTGKEYYTREDGSPLIYTCLGGNTENTDYLELPTYLLIKVPGTYFDLDDVGYITYITKNVYKHPVAGFLYANKQNNYKEFAEYIDDLVKTQSNLSNSDWAFLATAIMKTRGGYDAIRKLHCPHSAFLLDKLFSPAGVPHLITYVQWSQTKAAKDLGIDGISRRECVDFIFENYSYDTAALANMAITFACAINEPIPAAHPAIIEYAETNRQRVCEYVMSFPQYADEILSHLKDI